MSAIGDGARAALAAAAALLGCLGTGCVSTQEKVDAIKAVNREFCATYETIIAELGTRVVPVKREDAYVAIRAALAGLGMRLESQEPKLGVFTVYGVAPLPLEREEWDKVAETDLPLLRKLAEPHLGWLTTQLFLRFEPGGLQIVITATVLSVPAGTSVSLTARLREVSPPPSGFPRRECLSPAALRTGLTKIWSAFDRELAGAPKSS